MELQSPAFVMLDRASSEAVGRFLMDGERSVSWFLHPAKMSHRRCTWYLTHGASPDKLLLSTRGDVHCNSSLLTLAKCYMMFINWKQAKEASALGTFSSWLHTVTSCIRSGPCAYYHQCLASAK